MPWTSWPSSASAGRWPQHSVSSPRWPPGVKALVGFVGFVVAFISLAALRNFGPVLFYLGMAIFGAVGLPIAGAILGAVI